MIRAFWGLFCVGTWYDIFGEQLSALHRAGWPHPIEAHLTTGDSRHAFEAGALAGALGIPLRVVTHADNAFEYHSLRALHEATRPGDEVFYWHTKGVTHPGLISYVKWRWMLNYHLLTHWRGRLADLASYDVVGCCAHSGMVLGNFWAARGDWLAALPPVGRWQDRFLYERWLFSNPGAKVRALVSDSGEPAYDPYYARHGQPHLPFLRGD